MKALLIRADHGGCGFYRIEEPGRVTRDVVGADVEVDEWIHLDATKDDKTGEVVVHEIHEDVDVIVIQRPLKKYLTAVIAQAQAQGIAVVVDIDDNFDAIHPHNLSYASVQPEFSAIENRTWIHTATEIADLVTTSTPALAEHYASHGRAAILRNCVPENIGSISKSTHTPVRVGWTGTVQTHPGDLQTTDGGVARALRESKAEMRVVGDSYRVGEFLGLPIAQTVQDTGWLPRAEYYEAIAQNIDIGIVPLTPGRFNDAKSYLKGLEFAALGIPFIASPTEEYELLAESGIGVLAATSSDWRRLLNTWLKDGRKRTSDAKRYRDMVLAEYTYEVNAHQWVSAWQKAIDNRKAAQDVNNGS